MPSPLDISNIPAPRVEFIDPRTGLMAREWYRFFFNLFNLTGGGTNDTSLSDLQVGPPPINELLGELGITYDQAQLASMMAQYEQSIRDAINQIETAPAMPQLGTMAPLQQDNVPWFTFNTTPGNVPPNVGTIYWDDNEGTLDVELKGGNVTCKIGVQEYVRAYNETLLTMTKGQIVYISGAQGNRVAVKLAQADGDANSAHTIGIVAETITAGGEGFVQVSGPIYKLDTLGTIAGDTVYLSPTIAGDWTTTKPTAPDHLVIIGFIERVHASVGSIFIKVDNGYELDELHNVKITSVANGDLLQYDSSGPYWKNVASSTIGIGTATNLAGGVAGSLPYQSATSSTTFLGIGAADYILTSTGTAPTWTANTGTGNVVRATSPTLVTPILGSASATSVAFSLGAAATPSVTFTGDLNTGIWSPAADTVAVSTNGSERARIDTTGVVLINTTSATNNARLNQKLAVVSTGAGNYGGTGLISYSGTGVDTCPIIDLSRSRGTTDGSFTAVASGDRLGYVVWRGADGTAFQQAAAIRAEVDGTVSAGVIPSRLIFLTSATGTVSERMRIDSAGNIGVGTTTNLSKLSVAGPIALQSPSTVNAATYSVAVTDSSLRFTTTNNTLTLPSAASFPGRILYLNTITANSVTSAASNVIPLGSNTAGTAILAATAGKFAMLQSNGTNWITMLAN